MNTLIPEKSVDERLLQLDMLFLCEGGQAQGCISAQLEHRTSRPCQDVKKSVSKHEHRCLTSLRISVVWGRMLFKNLLPLRKTDLILPPGSCFFIILAASNKTAKSLQDTVYENLKLLKAEGGKIRASSEGSRPKDMAEITIELANSYPPVRRAEEEKPKQRAAVRPLLWVWVQSTAVAVVWKQLLLAHTDTEITTITTLRSGIGHSEGCN